MNVRDDRRGAATERMADHVLAQGLDAATLRPVAAAAGTSDRMLLYYFLDKRELLAAVMENLASRFLRELDDAIPISALRPFALLLEEVWAVLRSPQHRPYMNFWMDIAAGAARSLEPHHSVAGKIADGYLAWVATRLALFIHGWPELSVLWRHQLQAIARDGWRCVARDMRGYGGSSAPDSIAACAVRELVADMFELHNTLGGASAVWVGHDWGSAVAWAMASHHPARCRGIVNLRVHYLARGLALPVLVPLVDRTLYPEDQYPVGQWDYWLAHRGHFARTVADFEADPRATIATLYRTAPADAADKPATLASIRARGGWCGDARRAPAGPRDEALLNQSDFETVVAAFMCTGFAGADAWYLNDAGNMAYAGDAPNFGRLTLPALFLHVARDAVCRTADAPLPRPMREDCVDLTEVAINAGHAVMLERPDEVNAAITGWLPRKFLR